MRSTNITLTVLMLLAFAATAAAQGPVRWWAPTKPFDFSNAFYKVNGVIPEAIESRRTGADGISVPDKAPNDLYSDVRVLATVPAYDQDGNAMFWFPLGDLRSESFTPDKEGIKARETARKFPIYIFPDPKIDTWTAFTGHRHAPVIDVSKQWGVTSVKNPLSIRMFYTVTYTDMARGKQGWEMMQYMGKKNGWDTDDTPILKTVDDIFYLNKMGYVDVEQVWSGELVRPSLGFTIAPVLENPTAGAIYPDAFLIMMMKDGKPLPAEDVFVRQFTCLQKTLDFCRDLTLP